MIRRTLRSRACSFAQAACTAALYTLCSAAQANGTLYATGGGSNGSALYTVDTATGAATLAWNLPSSVRVQSGGLAWDPSIDTLFATGYKTSSTTITTLFSIDPDTGATAEIGPLGNSTLNLSSGGLALNPLTGVLYATGSGVGQSTSLYTVDKTTGLASLVGQNGGSCCTAPYGFKIDGLGFDADGRLWGNGITLSPNLGSQLFGLDLNTGLAASVGSHGVSVGGQLRSSGLAFGADGTLFSLGSTSASAEGLYRLDTTTGAATLVGGTTLNIIGASGGLAFVPSVPEPQSWALLAAGMGVLAWRRRNLAAQRDGERPKPPGHRSRPLCGAEPTQAARGRAVRALPGACRAPRPGSSVSVMSGLPTGLRLHR